MLNINFTLFYSQITSCTLIFKTLKYNYIFESIRSA